jgi:peptidyl-prolyl cis-trans isomerase D
MTSSEFVNRIKNALVMEQFQRSIIDSAFTTQYDVEHFFKIQNQQRDFDYVTVPVPKLTEQPPEQDIAAYYQQHLDSYKTPEQISVEYVELALDEIAKSVTVTEDRLKAFYEEQKDQYTTAERRKISHILFAINDKTDEKSALAKALKAKQELATKDFAALAAEQSDDKLSAKNGGDLGLFNAGAMEKAFDDAASTLALGEVSNPVKSAFGYHLIKVTELAPGVVKPFDAVKAEVSKAYQKAQAENAFYEAGEKLTESSYENPDNLQTVSDALNLPVKKSAWFTRDQGEGLAADPKIRTAAFSEEVLQGNNSAPVELGVDRLVVLRMLEHKPAATRVLDEVKQEVIATLLKEKAKQQAAETAQKIKERLQAGGSIQAIAAENKLEIKKITGLTRSSGELPGQLSQDIFQAAKPVGGKPTIFTALLPSDAQVVVNLSKVTEGAMTENDKKQLELATKNIAKAIGQTEFDAVLNSLQEAADISVKAVKTQ